MSFIRRSAQPIRSRMLTAAVAAVLSILFIGGCGDPKGQAVPIVVTFNPANAPPTTLDTGSYAPIAANVANDTQNAGVNFSCTPTGACGSFTPASAGTTDPVCYLAPDAIPMNGSVVVTATSVTDPTKSVSATIDILSGAPNPCP